MSSQINRLDSYPKRTEISHLEEVPAEKLDLHKARDTQVSNFPEGGTRAWMAVAGAFLCLFAGGVVCLPK